MKKILFFAITIALAFFSLPTFAQTVGQEYVNPDGDTFVFKEDHKWHKAKFPVRDMNGVVIGMYRTRQAHDSAVYSLIHQQVSQTSQTQQVSSNRPTIVVSNSYKSNNQTSAYDNGYYNEYNQRGYGGNQQFHICSHCHDQYVGMNHFCTRYLFEGQVFYEGAKKRCTRYTNGCWVPNLFDGTWCTLRRDPHGFLGWFPTHTMNSGYYNTGWGNEYYQGYYGGQYQQQPYYNRYDDGSAPPPGWEHGVTISR